jgi:plasmid replication initiation protein
MSRGRFYNPQFDLFLPTIVDLRFRDQKDTMEQPFFSLSKSKRMKPIEYLNENDGIFVTVQPHQDYGMATIWDADILIWAASVLCDMKNRGVNDIPRVLTFQPYDLLKAIGRATGGSDYGQLRDALERLKTSVITTNIRLKKRGQKNTMFSWIDQWDDLIDAQTRESRGLMATYSARHRRCGSSRRTKSARFATARPRTTLRGTPNGSACLRPRGASRCQRRTVSGFTRSSASLHRGTSRASSTKRPRSDTPILGRLIARAATISCWRRRRFSATSWVRERVASRSRPTTTGAGRVSA